MIAHVAEGDAEDIDRAVAAARKAFDEGPWPKMSAYVRPIPLDWHKFSSTLCCFVFVYKWMLIYSCTGSGKVTDTITIC